LWVKDPPPIEYIIDALSARWHCPPDEIRRQSAQDFVNALVIMGAEGEVAKASRR
jgi:hypothetical protein